MLPNHTPMPETPAMTTSEPPQFYTIRPDERASEAVIRAVTAEEGTEFQLDSPLYDHIEPDALDSLFRSDQERPNRHISVEFDYCGYTVVVSARTVELH
ncbi:HalOD1 output domain-containing protein [Haladaptatus caseinilyticus]|uniref:HalOD1 output domain-containing protein n=1 Tax=Haladaptatus caseinilyticus TaxID=2993314 RepID=UPI00224A6148|nr:HalOD1 output domain-containing protein [Haladaptatus caseinilyticus]